MSAETVLSQTIKHHLLELKSDKVTVRTKSLDSIERILDDRPNDLKTAIANGDEDTIKWTELYFGLHDSLKDQCDRLDKCTRANFDTTRNKNGVYNTVITKCINLANENVPHIPLRTVFDTVLECFENATSCKFFASCYLKIAHRYVLNTKSNLNELKLTDWARKHIQSCYVYSDRHFIFAHNLFFDSV